MAEPSATELILGRIQAAEENTKDSIADLKDRIATSDKHTDETFVAHENRDQERFDETTQALVAHREQLGHQISNLTTEVRATNGGLKGVEARVGILEYGESLVAAKAARRLSWRQGVTYALVGAFAVGLVTVILFAAGVGHG